MGDKKTDEAEPNEFYIKIDQVVPTESKNFSYIQRRDTLIKAFKKKNEIRMKDRRNESLC